VKTEASVLPICIFASSTTLHFSCLCSLVICTNPGTISLPYSLLFCFPFCLSFVIGPSQFFLGSYVFPPPSSAPYLFVFSLGELVTSDIEFISLSPWTRTGLFLHGHPHPAAILANTFLACITQIAASSAIHTGLFSHPPTSWSIWFKFLRPSTPSHPHTDQPNNQSYAYNSHPYTQSLTQFPGTSFPTLSPILGIPAS
jgi:hypothetical protein